MRQADLARGGRRPAADQRHIGACVMRGAERSSVQHSLVRVENAGNRMNAGRLQRFLKSEFRQNGRDTPGQHGLSRPRRADQKEVMATIRWRELRLN